MTTTTTRELWPSLKAELTEKLAKYPSARHWVQAHNRAVDGPSMSVSGLVRATPEALARRTAEFAIVNALNSWQLYGAFHESRYESKIGDDGVLGPAWLEWGKSLCALLNGELGRLDGGTCWTYIDETLKRGGFEAGLES